MSSTTSAAPHPAHRHAEPGLRDTLATVISSWTERRAPDREIPLTPSTSQLVVAALLALIAGIAIYGGLVVLVSRATGKAP